MKIENISLKNISNDKLAGFAHNLERLMARILTPEEMAEFRAFTTNLSALDVSLQNTKLNLGKRVAEVDKLVDQAWLYMHRHLTLDLDHHSAERRELAARLLKVLNTEGNPTTLSYLKEYAVLERLVPVLEAVPESDWIRADLEGWVPELRRRFDLFNTLRTDQQKAKADKITGLVKRIRNELITNIHDVFEEVYVNAYIHKPQFETLSQEINALIQQVKLQMKIDKAKKADDSEKKTQSTEAKLDQLVPKSEPSSN